jgi:serine phosphatase RsbU (regulator of sigma subunit)
LETQTDVLKDAYSEIKIQKDKVDYLFSEMKSGIRAAQDLQQSLLPDPTVFADIFQENFIFYKSKDSVSGDFYWFGEKDGKYIIAVVDCTGHGVSGAIMAINGHYLLNKAIERTGELIASNVLNNLNSEVFKELRLKDSENRNGMDISLCIFHPNGELQFAGANHQLYIVHDNQVLITKGDRFPIGLTGSHEVKSFTNHVIHVVKGDMIYMFSDGYYDQFGGENGEDKFLPFRFRDLLLEINREKADKQSDLMEKRFLAWKGTHEQTDDILVLGFRI